MPYMHIYKATDGKWHQGNCETLSSQETTGARIIGSIGEPDPPKSDMCPVCFFFLFEDRKPSR